MKRILVLLIAMACIPLQAKESKPEDMQVRQIVVGMDVDVAADGAVSGVVPDLRLPADLRQLLVTRVSQWRYRPATWHGESVSTKAYLALRLSVAPEGSDGVVVRILGADSECAVDTGYCAEPPRYPAEAAQANTGGTFVYALAKDANGKMTGVRMLSPTGRPLHMVERAMDKASRKSFETSRWRPSFANGNTVACEEVLPISFSMGSSSADGTGQAALEKLKEKMLPQLSEACPTVVLETAIENVLLYSPAG
ncbi:energy transducer TonB [Pseudoxanthomonas sacheonensis]|uniref:energy transducer TonB n=1 Tax=Pseudoxanthomonas sacheonensis TaxID=443615 RepID=UPI0013D7BB40|nr:energy transducer TonB [Pseudoxanthomonas sacheonensis]